MAGSVTRLHFFRGPNAPAPLRPIDERCNFFAPTARSFLSVTVLRLHLLSCSRLRVPPAPPNPHSPLSVTPTTRLILPLPLHPVHPAPLLKPILTDLETSFRLLC